MTNTSIHLIDRNTEYILSTNEDDDNSNPFALPTEDVDDKLVEVNVNVESETLYNADCIYNDINDDEYHDKNSDTGRDSGDEDDDGVEYNDKEIMMLLNSSSSSEDSTTSESIPLNTPTSTSMTFGNDNLITLHTSPYTALEPITQAQSQAQTQMFNHTINSSSTFKPSNSTTSQPSHNNESNHKKHSHYVFKGSAPLIDPETNSDSYSVRNGEIEKGDRDIEVILSHSHYHSRAHAQVKVSTDNGDDVGSNKDGDGEDFDEFDDEGSVTSIILPMVQVYDCNDFNDCNDCNSGSGSGSGSGSVVSYSKVKDTNEDGDEERDVDCVDDEEGSITSIPILLPMVQVDSCNSESSESSEIGVVGYSCVSSSGFIGAVLNDDRDDDDDDDDDVEDVNDVGDDDGDAVCIKSNDEEYVCVNYEHELDNANADDDDDDDDDDKDNSNDDDDDNDNDNEILQTSTSSESSDTVHVINYVYNDPSEDGAYPIEIEILNYEPQYTKTLMKTAHAFYRLKTNQLREININININIPQQQTIEIQHLYDTIKNTSVEHYLTVHLTSSVVQIQAWTRRILSSNNCAARIIGIVKIQSFIRSSALQREYYRIKLGVISIQRAFKFKSGKYQSILTTQKVACRILTSTIKNFQTKCNYKYLLTRIIKIQSTFRRHHERKPYTDLKIRVLPILRRFFKGCKRRVDRDYKVFCVGLIQSWVRRFVVLRRFGRDVNAVGKVQALWRMICVKRRNNAKLIKDREDCAVAMIQKNYRSYSASMNFMSIVYSVIVIQTQFRFYLGRRKW